MGEYFKTQRFTEELARETLAAVGELNYQQWVTQRNVSRNDYSTFCTMLGTAGLAHKVGHVWRLAVPLADALAGLELLPWLNTKFARHGPGSDIKTDVPRELQPVRYRIRQGALSLLWFVHSYGQTESDNCNVIPEVFDSKPEAVAYARRRAEYLAHRRGVAVLYSYNDRDELIIALSEPVPGGRVRPLTAK